MRIDPKTQEEIDAENMLEKGIYDFEVIRAEDKVSKKGNEMIKATLKVFHGDSSQLVDDYLMEAMMAKLLHFCNETGLSDLYQAGELHAADCVGRCGRVKIDIEPAGEFPAKNVVKDYGEKKKSDASAKGPLMNAGPRHVTDEPSDTSEVPF